MWAKNDLKMIVQVVVKMKEVIIVSLKQVITYPCNS